MFKYKNVNRKYHEQLKFIKASIIEDEEESMKRYLLTSSTILALTMMSAPVLAQSKFEIRIGGDAIFDAGITSQDRDTDRRSVVFRDRFRLNTVATGKADNGLSYGTNLRLRSMAGTGSSNTVDADRAYLFVAGSFGHLRMGTAGSYNIDTLAGWSGIIPYGWQTGTLILTSKGVDHAAGGNATAINATLAAETLTENSNGSKIYYYTPTFAGFRMAATYTPNTGSSGYSVDRSTSAASGYQDVLELDATFQREFSGVGLTAIGTYMGGRAKDAGLAQREDLRAFQVGAKISYGGFALGGSYINKFDSGLVAAYHNKTDQEIWGVGLEYAAGPVTFGGAYLRGQGNVTSYGTATTTSAGVTRYVGAVKQDTWQLGALYTVASGLRVGAEYNYIKADAPGTADDDKANVFMLHSIVAF